LDEIEQQILKLFLDSKGIFHEYVKFYKVCIEQLQNGSKHIENTKEQNKPRTIAEATGYQGMYSDRTFLEDRN